MMQSLALPSSSDISASSSRPTSPAEEASEIVTPTEEEDQKKIDTTRRKSVWKKALGLKKQLSKVNLKVTDGVRRGSVFFGPTEGTPLSPVEVSPPELSPNSVEHDRYKLDMVAQIEKDVVQSLDDLDFSNETSIAKRFEDNESSESDAESDCGAEWKRRIMAQPQNLQTRRSDATSEELAVRQFAVNSEGARISRPSELSLFDGSGRPIPAPPSKSRESRKQRLLSVPNIKYQRKESIKPNDKRKEQQPSTFAGNFMRRFSKY